MEVSSVKLEAGRLTIEGTTEQINRIMEILRPEKKLVDKAWKSLSMAKIYHDNQIEKDLCASKDYKDGVQQGFKLVEMFIETIEDGGLNNE
jgi:hypothetical protein